MLPVLVNPNKPMSLDDFAQMYTANGQTPQQNASNLWFNAPTEGKSYMEDQWTKLGVGSSPEQLFSNPAQAAAALASSSPSVQGARPQADAMGRIPVLPGNTGQEQWPMYSNEAARQTAMNLGMDQRSSYTTPDRMMASVSSHLAGTPHDPEHLLRDPQLQSLMQVDPAKAKFIYEKLTGASYDKDKAEVDSIDRTQKLAALTQQRELQASPMKFGIKTVQDLISRGAHFDPNTGQLSTWQNVEPDAGSIDNRPVRKRIPATPEEKYIWEHYYPFAMGMPSPHGASSPDPALQAANAAQAAQPTDIQKKIEANITALNPRTPAERQAIIDKTIQENHPMFSGPEGDSRYNDMATAFTSAIIGKQGWKPEMSYRFSELPNNAWGNIMDKGTAWVHRFMHGRDIPYSPPRDLTIEEQAALEAARGVAIPGLP